MLAGEIDHERESKWFTSGFSSDKTGCCARKKRKHKKIMSEISDKNQVEAPLNSSAMIAPNELKRSVKIQELPHTVLNNHITPAGISRERSFVRTMTPLNQQVSGEREIERFFGDFILERLSFRTWINAAAWPSNSSNR
jgi:hypothetical protein